MTLYNKVVTPTKVFCNDMIAISDWTEAATSSLNLANNKTAAVALVKLKGIPTGAKVLKVTTHLGVKAGSSADQDTKYTLSVRKVINASADVTDAEIKGNAEVTATASAKTDADVDTTFTIDEGYSYYLRVTSTTGSDAAAGNNLIGATVTYQ